MSSPNVNNSRFDSEIGYPFLTQPPAAGAVKPLKAWRSPGEPIVRFRTDDGKVYGSPFQSLATAFDETSRSLAVECHHGTILITGPGTQELEDALCAHRATMIRTDGKAITSVTLRVEDETKSNGLTGRFNFDD